MEINSLVIVARCSKSTGQKAAKLRMFTRRSPKKSTRIVCCREPKTIGLKKVNTTLLLLRICYFEIVRIVHVNCIADGSGYVEDGREIFDEVEEDDEIEERSSKKRKADSSMPKESKKRLRGVSKPAQGKGSIRNLFGNVSANKKKEPQVKLEEDDILAGILGEVGPESSSNSNKTNEAGPSRVGDAAVGVPSTSSELNAKTEMAMVKQYMVNLTKAVHKKPAAVKNEAASDDDVSSPFLNFQLFHTCGGSSCFSLPFEGNVGANIETDDC